MWKSDNHTLQRLAFNQTMSKKGGRVEAFKVLEEEEAKKLES